MATATATAPVTRPTSSADGVSWNLTDLYQGVDDPALTRDLEAAQKRAQAFEATYRGKMNVAGGPSPDTLLIGM